jgi:hypothetical protein
MEGFNGLYLEHGVDEGVAGGGEVQTAGDADGVPVWVV